MRRSYLRQTVSLILLLLLGASLTTLLAHEEGHEAGEILVKRDPIAHESMASAISREKAIKNWKRAWKIKVIEAMNPQWRDLYDDLL